MNREDKLRALSAWLHDKGYEAYEPEEGDCRHLSYLRLIVRKPHIYIFVCNAEDEGECFLHAVADRHARAFFIREADTQEFLVEKMTNCINDMETKRMALKAWRAVGYGAKKHHKLGIGFPEFLEEFKKLAYGNAIDYAYEQMVAKYKPINEAAFAPKLKRKRVRVHIAHKPTYEKVSPKNKQL